VANLSRSSGEVDHDVRAVAGAVLGAGELGGGAPDPRPREPEEGARVALVAGAQRVDEHRVPFRDPVVQPDLDRGAGLCGPHHGLDVGGPRQPVLQVLLEERQAGAVAVETASDLALGRVLLR
jgi:hypothetical protein